MKPQPAPAKATRRDATLNMCEHLLAGQAWLKGNAPSAQDRSALEAIGEEAPNAEFHPNVFAWWSIASGFTEEARASWE